MMELVYLKNGQQAYLVESTSTGKFVVEPIFEYTDHEGNTFDDTGAQTIVDAIFKTKPVEKIDEDIKNKQSQYDAVHKELRENISELAKTRNELHRAKTELTNLSKWKLDFSQYRNCKSFAFFVLDRVEPVFINNVPKYSQSRFKLHLSVDMWNGEIARFVTAIDAYNEGLRDWNNYVIDEEYGFFFDTPHDELVRIAKERSENMNLDKLHYTQKSGKIPEIYRTPRIEAHIQECEQKEIQNRIARLQEEIAKKNQELQSITNP